LHVWCAPEQPFLPAPNNRHNQFGYARQEEDMSTTTATTTFAVTGMTCGHCVAAVTEELSALPGVTKVSVDLVANGTSTVKVASDTPINLDQVAASLTEAGDYRLATD
jgi:copper chaperone